MNYRMTTIWPRRQYIADKTEIIEINLKDPISQLCITYEPDNNPGGVHATAHPAKCITKIELVDGSNVLCSMSGQEAQALDFYHNDKSPANIICYLNGMYSEQIFNINFGRYLYDTMLALDPKKFNNLQLKITMDIDGGGDESNDGYLTVIAHVFDQKAITPIGFLGAKEVKSYVLTAGGHEYTDLPTDATYKQILFKAQRYGTGPEYQINTIKVEEDNSKRVILDNSMFQIIRNIASQWKMHKEWILCWGSTTKNYYYNTACYFPTFTDTPWRNSYAACLAAVYGGDGGRFEHDCEASGPNHQVHAMGYAPHAAVPLLPKFSNDVADWYNVDKIGNLRIDALAVAAPGASQTAEILIQQLRKY